MTLFIHQLALFEGISAQIGPKILLQRVLLIQLPARLLLKRRWPDQNIAEDFLFGRGLMRPVPMPPANTKMICFDHIFRNR